MSLKYYIKRAEAADFHEIGTYKKRDQTADYAAVEIKIKSYGIYSYKMWFPLISKFWNSLGMFIF